MKQLVIGIGMMMLGCMIFPWICKGQGSLLGMAQYRMNGQIENVCFR